MHIGAVRTVPEIRGSVGESSQNEDEAGCGCPGVLAVRPVKSYAISTDAECCSCVACTTSLTSADCAGEVVVDVN